MKEKIFTLFEISWSRELRVLRVLSFSADETDRSLLTIAWHDEVYQRGLYVESMGHEFIGPVAV